MDEHNENKIQRVIPLLTCSEFHGKNFTLGLPAASF